MGSRADPRFSFANERTFLAWNRTALTRDRRRPGRRPGGAPDFGRSAGGLIVGLALIVLGAATGIAGVARWWSSETAMRLRAPLPRVAPRPRPARHRHCSDRRALSRPADD